MSTSIDMITLPGLTPYAEAWELQLARRNAVSAGTQPEAVFLVEHPPVITCGRDFHAEHLLHRREKLAAMGIDVLDVERGGDVTYHGPGQLVAYPILNLSQRGGSVGGYIRALEEVLIRVLSEWGLAAGRMAGYTGVWVNGAKVAAIGIGVHRWVSFHGIALNVNPNLEHFGLIVPCGISDKPVTSMAELLGEAPSLRAVRDQFSTHFLQLFGDG